METHSNLTVTILVIDIALWSLAMVLAFSKHVRQHEGDRAARSRARFQQK